MASTQVLAVAGSSLAQGAPWVLLTHSMGCWVGYELLRAMQAAGGSSGIDAVQSVHMRSSRHVCTSLHQVVCIEVHQDRVLPQYY